MVEAGFHYFPVKDGKDNAFCPHCEVELANWEPEDDPWEEHYRRAKDCPFIVSKDRRPKKPARRPSVQSVVSDGDSFADEEPKRGRKPVRGKATAKGRGKKAARSPSIEPTPEIEAPGPKRGRKRASNAVNTEPVIMFDGTKDTEDEAELAPDPRPVKRRTRASNVQKFDILDNEASAEVLAQPLKANARAGKKAATSKASSKQAAAKKQRGYEDDADIPLDIHLGEPVSEEDEPVATHQPFARTIRRTTRSRASIIVEQQAKNAPEDVLIHTAKRHKSKPPGYIPDSVRHDSVKPFFKEEEQDFSIPIKIPQRFSRQESPTANAPVLSSEDEDEDHKSEYEAIMAAPKPVKGRGKKTPTEFTAASKAKKPVGRVKGHKKEPVEEIPDSDVIEDQEMPDSTAEPTSLPPKKSGKRSSKSTQKRTLSPSTAPVEEQMEVDEDEPELPRSLKMEPQEHISEQHPDLTSDDTIPDVAFEAPQEDAPQMSTAAVEPPPESMEEDDKVPTASPAHKSVIVPLTTTPSKSRPRITTTAPWSPADLQTVFPSPKDTDSSGPAVLTDQEKEMTVEEWIKWNAAAAERRHCELAERRVRLLEEHGKRAVAALEGIQIC